MREWGELHGDSATLAAALLAALQGGILLAPTSGSLPPQGALELALDGLKAHLTDDQRPAPANNRPWPSSSGTAEAPPAGHGSAR